MKVIAIKPVRGDMPRAVKKPAGFRTAVIEAARKIKAQAGRGRKTYSYIRFFQDYDGEILETIYAVKYGKATKKEAETATWQLVYAGTPTRKWSSGNLLFGSMCGYVCLWDEHETRGSYAYSYQFDPSMVRCRDDSWRPGLQIIETCDPIEAESSLYTLRNFPKYLDVFEMTQCSSLGEITAYCAAFIKYPSLERLQKAGLAYLWREKRLLNAKPRYAKKLLSYIKGNIADIRARRPSLNFIIGAMKEGMTIDQYEWHQIVMSVESAVCGIDGFFPKEMAGEVAKYLQRQNGGPLHYRDYLDLSAALGRDIESRGVLFPKDFCKQFDELQKIAAGKESEALNARISIALEKLNLPRAFSKKSLVVRPITSQQDLVEMGNRLHNCVGTCGYGAQMADGKIVILGVFQNGVPMNCVELLVPEKTKNGTKAGNGYRVLQNLGDHNRPSPVQTSAEYAVNAFITEANKGWRQAHASA